MPSDHCLQEPGGSYLSGLAILVILPRLSCVTQSNCGLHMKSGTVGARPWADQHQTWLPALGAAVFGLTTLLLLRLPLWLLPGPGRDEAAYHYWAHHPELAYAPLLQLAVRLSELLLGNSLWSLRLPVIVLGLVVLILNDRRLAGAGASVANRRLAAIALATCAWQGYVSSVLHPDNFLLAALLGLILAVQNNRLGLATVAAVAAVLAKPTGLLVLPVLWWLAGRLPEISQSRLWTARLVLLGLAVGQFAVTDLALVGSLADFGRLSGSLSWSQRGLAAGGALLFLGGPLLLIMAGSGLPQRLRILRAGGSGPAVSEAVATLATAGVLSAVFLAAVVMRGQFKGNWVLPAVILLWPTATPRWLTRRGGQTLAVAGLAVAMVGGLGQTVALARPELVDQLEHMMVSRSMVPRWATYATQSGLREVTVSTSRTWADHLREFSGTAAFAETISCQWRDALGDSVPLRWILSNDYGLACQLAWGLGDPDLRVAICGDGIFGGTWAEFTRAAPAGPLLALSRSPLAADCLPLGNWGPGPVLPPIPHPVTGNPLWAKVLVRQTNANKETSDADIP